MKTNLLKILTVAVLIIAIFGCRSNEANNANSSVAESGSSPNVNSNSNSNFAVVTNANVNSNANAKPAENSPKRIIFNKGANWGSVNVTLAAGAAQKFIVGAKSGQMMTVETSSKETSVNLTKGKAETTEDFGFLDAELKANGDYVFEVRNGTKKEIKTSVKVTIEAGDKKSENSDSVPVDDNDESLEPNESGH